MIRVLVVDDHPALRAGLTAVLRSERGLAVVGAAAGDADLWPLMYATSPDVVILDYHMPGAGGLRVCRRLKARTAPPAVLIFSAYADPNLALPARLAGADGLLDKAARASVLFESIRAVAAGGRVLPEITRAELNAAAARVDPDDLPFLGMLLERTTPAEIAAALRIDVATIGPRIDRILLALQVQISRSG